MTHKRILSNQIHRQEQIMQPLQQPAKSFLFPKSILDL